MDKAHAETEEKLKEMEEHLRQTYERANQEIGASWTAYLKQADKEIEGLQKEYDKAKESGDPDLKRKTGIALSKAKKEKTFQNAQYQRQAAQLAEDLKHVNETAVAYVNDQLPEVYAVNYNNLADSVDGVGGYSFTLVDAQTVKNLALEDETLLPYKKVDGRKDVRWNTKIINAEVEQGILQGETMQEIADRLFNITAMEANAAIRNARTSVTSAEGKGRFDSYVKADSDGIIMEIEWVATPGKRTRESHAKLDGKRVKPGEPFKSILGLIRYPGDPEATPGNTYNCRCTTIAVVLGFRKKGGKKNAAVEVKQKQKAIRGKYRSLRKKLNYTKEEQEEFKLLQRKYKNIEGAMLFGTIEDLKRYKELLKKEKQNTKKYDFFKLFKNQTISESQLYSWSDTPTKQQRDAISSYSRSGYLEMNAHLRSQKYVPQDIKNEINYLSNYLEKSKTKEIIYLSRGINKHTVDILSGNGDWQKDESKIIGSVFTDKGFVSTTPYEGGGFGGDVIMYIKAPKGTKGAYIKKYAASSEEKEFLLQKESSFVIRNVKKEIDKFGDARYKIYAEVIV